MKIALEPVVYFYEGANFSSFEGDLLKTILLPLICNGHELLGKVRILNVLFLQTAYGEQS